VLRKFPAAFITPNVRDVLVHNCDIRPISTPKEEFEADFGVMLVAGRSTLEFIIVVGDEKLNDYFK
jgi:hypothetical protein